MDKYKLVEEGNLEDIAKWLDSVSGADFAGFNINGLGLLHLAAQRSNPEILEILIAKGIEYDCISERGDDAIEHASRTGNLENVKLLIVAGSSPNGSPYSRIPPLHSAIISGHLNVCEYLVEAGADVNRIYVRTGELPLDLARVWSRPAIEKILINHNAKSGAGDFDFENEVGGEIINYVNSKIERVIPVNLENGNLWIAEIGGYGKPRMVFSSGLHRLSSPMLELFLVVPELWDPYLKSDDNQFPIKFLNEIKRRLKEEEIELAEGSVLNATDFSSLSWPHDIEAVVVVDHYWGNEPSNEVIAENEQVNLYTLLPIKRTKKGIATQDLVKNKKATWNKLTLKLND